MLNCTALMLGTVCANTLQYLQRLPVHILLLKNSLNLATYTKISCIADLHACNSMMRNGDLLVNGCAALPASLLLASSADCTLLHITVRLLQVRPGGGLACLNCQ